MQRRPIVSAGSAQYFARDRALSTEFLYLDKDVKSDLNTLLPKISNASWQAEQDGSGQAIKFSLSDKDAVYTISKIDGHIELEINPNSQINLRQEAFIASARESVVREEYKLSDKITASSARGKIDKQSLIAADFFATLSKRSDSWQSID